jgi:hypothetical protein
LHVEIAGLELARARTQEPGLAALRLGLQHLERAALGLLQRGLAGVEITCDDERMNRSMLWARLGFQHGRARLVEEYVERVWRQCPRASRAATLSLMVADDLDGRGESALAARYYRAARPFLAPDLAAYASYRLARVHLREGELEVALGELEAADIGDATPLLRRAVQAALRAARARVRPP